MASLKNQWFSRLICFGSALGFLGLGLYILQQDDLIKCVSTRQSGIICSNYAGSALIAWGIGCILLGAIPMGLYWLDSHPKRAKVFMGIGFLAMASFTALPFFKQ